MLISTGSIEELYHQSCALAHDPVDVRESFQHPTRLIQFLVGLRGKNEPMAIGGPWSPSLDGPNPDTDPRVLIKTAIRTTKKLTGIDLSNCTQWWVECNLVTLSLGELSNFSFRKRFLILIMFSPLATRPKSTSLLTVVLHSNIKIGMTMTHETAA